MAQLRKLAPEEVRAIEDKGKGPRKLTEEQYDQFLADFSVGDYGEVTPDTTENRLTVRNRLKAAARRRELSLTFMRTRGFEMRFKVEQGSAEALTKRKPIRRSRDVQEPTPVVPSLNQAPIKKKPGRPKQTA
jgi:hypothetical protein